MKTSTKVIIDKHVGGSIVFILNNLFRIFRFRNRNKSVTPKTIVVCKFLGMGSIVQSTPLLQTFKKQFPDCKIIYLSSVTNKNFLGQISLIDETIIINDKSLFSTIISTLSCIRILLSKQIDLFIDLEVYSNFSKIFTIVSNADLKFGALPFSFFSALANFKACDRISLYDTSSHTLAAIGFSLHINGQYYPWVLGLNYTFQGAYRQLLYSAVLRAKQLTCHQLHFGFTADEEKGKLNTNAKPKLAFVQMNDNFNMNELHLMEMFTTQRMV